MTFPQRVGITYMWMPDELDPLNPSTTSQVLCHLCPRELPGIRDPVLHPPLTLMTALPGVYHLHFQQKKPSLRGCPRSRGSETETQL